MLYRVIFYSNTFTVCIYDYGVSHIYLYLILYKRKWQYRIYIAKRDNRNEQLHRKDMLAVYSVATTKNAKSTLD